MLETGSRYGIGPALLKILDWISFRPESPVFPVAGFRVLTELKLISFKSRFLFSSLFPETWQFPEFYFFSLTRVLFVSFRVQNN